MAEQATPANTRPMTIVERLDAAQNGDEFAVVMGDLFVMLSAARWPDDDTAGGEQ